MTAKYYLYRRNRAFSFVGMNRFTIVYHTWVITLPGIRFLNRGHSHWLQMNAFIKAF